jgi:hypothetical protein
MLNAVYAESIDDATDILHTSPVFHMSLMICAKFGPFRGETTPLLFSSMLLFIPCCFHVGRLFAHAHYEDLLFSPPYPTQSRP